MPAKFIQSPDRHAHPWVGRWLLVMALMVMLMAFVGAATRLTESGLSIVDWRPVTGAVPPLSKNDWQVEFKKYQTSPQYQKMNKDMTLSDFKNIYWWEYIHRLIGRVLGVVFIVPFVVAIARRHLSLQLGLKIFSVFLLGGLQGAIGWWMVKSGLVNTPAVSAYRLGIHLTLAAVIYAGLLYLGLSVLLPSVQKNKIDKWFLFLTILFFITLFSGALMAGSDAGLTYNTYPLMDGKLFPTGYLQLTPWWRNFFENVTAIQFNHRFLTFAWFVSVIISWLKMRRVHLVPRHRKVLKGLLHLTFLQLIWGVALLLIIGRLGHIPVYLASMHQLFAFAILGMVIWALYEQRIRPIATRSSRG